ncbi:pseudouridine synthase [Membranihabitans marinus]|uniref:pseudouridine synthase n=1 Tax=Membranihabitans marinus TaxID=1227546 RepID=UPI001F4826BA|nr:pseudouridine synthase [Membranihabitans marinus]
MISQEELHQHSLWPMRLNKFIAYAGICSRRKAEELVKKGSITVNDEIVTQPFIEVLETDIVKYKGDIINISKNYYYLLLNKPKNFISTASDEKNRKSILDLIQESKTERLYPVGRLDRNTTGLILITNDGHFAQKLAHPKNNITKIYRVILDKDVAAGDLEKFQNGGQLDDGFFKPDVVNFVDSNSTKELHIEIHSGKNRIVRRYFEHFGYTVIKLDREYYAGLTKKGLSRGRYRRLTANEIRNLMHLGK